MAGPRRRRRSGTSSNNHGHDPTVPNKNRRGIKKRPRFSSLRKFLQTYLLGPLQHDVLDNTRQACLVLCLAILTGWLWNYGTRIEVDPAVASFLQRICQEDAAPCHPAMVPARRTQQTTRHLAAGTRLFAIPRRLLILDVDALRDPFIQEQLLQPQATTRDRDSARPHLDSAAYLAVHLARLLQQLVDDSSVHNTSALDPILQEYLATLPTYEDYVAMGHPLLTWKGNDEEEDQDNYHTIITNRQSSTFQEVQQLQSTILSEYQQFCDLSDEFCSSLSFSAYQTARLHVLTRSFGTGPLVDDEPPIGETSDTHQEWRLSWDDEVAYYEKVLGINPARTGAHAMVPILDLYQHHAQPHVSFQYGQGQFVVTTITSVAAGTEIRDYYGKHTDAHLFAKYGFVNGDGSDPTQANLALWHSFSGSNGHKGKELPLRTDLLRYLQYDDGHAACVTRNDGAAWELKRLKYRRLLQYANASRHWTVIMAPRSPQARPGSGSHVASTVKPPRVDPSKVQFLQGSHLHILATCRLLSLTVDDYNDTALQLLKDHDVDNDGDFELPVDAVTSPLEYRSWMCVARLADTAMTRFGVSSVENQWQQVYELNQDSEKFQSPEWTTAHLILGELQTLQALKGIAFAQLQRNFASYMDNKDKTPVDPAYIIRNKACPPRHLMALLSSEDSTLDNV